MSNVKVLDCTLRDGGYVNEWKFGEDNIKSILNKLVDANIDYIEYGFMSDAEYSPGTTIFSSADQINNFILEKKNSKFFAMIRYGQYAINNIKQYKEGSITDGFRVIFKKDKTKEAFEYCKQIKEKGYKLFINLSNFDTYTKKDLAFLVQNVNKIKPDALGLVDTKGALQRIDVTETFSFVDKNMDDDIALCFHSHNNLRLSFINARVLMHTNTKRNLIIDSCVLGMGRGAGNLCTEELIEYANSHFNGRYNTVAIRKIIQEHLNDIYEITKWGYNTHYHLAASQKCHPNYASFLSDMGVKTNEDLNNIFQSIPQDKKEEYDKKVIEKLYETFINAQM